jgi:hypothetical protein
MRDRFLMFCFVAYLAAVTTLFHVVPVLRWIASH